MSLTFALNLNKRKPISKILMTYSELSDMCCALILAGILSNYKYYPNFLIKVSKQMLKLYVNDLLRSHENVLC